MDFSYSEKTEQIRAQLGGFMEEYIVPRIGQWRDETHLGQFPVSFMDDLKNLARSEGLWNLFLPHLRDDEPGTRLTNLEYAPLAEIMGRVPWSSEVFNCSAPDTGNMEVLHMFATEAQREEYLVPLMNGEIRSAFAMTEPDVASSDATNIQTLIQRKGEDDGCNGRKGGITMVNQPKGKGRHGSPTPASAYRRIQSATRSEPARGRFLSGPNAGFGALGIDGADVPGGPRALGNVRPPLRVAALQGVHRRLRRRIARVRVRRSASRAHRHDHSAWRQQGVARRHQ